LNDDEDVDEEEIPLVNEETSDDSVSPRAVEDSMEDMSLKTGEEEDVESTTAQEYVEETDEDSGEENKACDGDGELEYPDTNIQLQYVGGEV